MLLALTFDMHFIISLHLQFPPIFWKSCETGQRFIYTLFFHACHFLAILKKQLFSRTEDSVSFYLCMYGFCHTNQIEATILPCKLVIHQWNGPFKQYIPEGQPRRQLGFGHLENIASWKHLDDFSTLFDRSQFFTLRPSNVLNFPASVKLVPTCTGLLGWDSRFYIKDFVLQISVMRTKRLWSLSKV